MEFSKSRLRSRARTHGTHALLLVVSLALLSGFAAAVAAASSSPGGGSTTGTVGSSQQPPVVLCATRKLTVCYEVWPGPPTPPHPAPAPVTTTTTPTATSGGATTITLGVGALPLVIGGSRTLYCAVRPVARIGDQDGVAVNLASNQISSGTFEGTPITNAFEYFPQGVSTSTGRGIGQGILFCNPYAGGYFEPVTFNGAYDMDGPYYVATQVVSGAVNAIVERAPVFLRGVRLPEFIR